LKNSKNDIVYSLSEVAEKTGAVLQGDGSVQIRGVAPIESAAEGDISFVANRTYAKHIPTTGASALVLDHDTNCDNLPVIRHQNPYLTFALVVDLLYPDVPAVAPGIHPTAVVDPDSEIQASAAVGPFCQVGKGSTIGENCQLLSSVYLGDNASIGNNSKLYPGVRVMNGCKIGRNVIIHSGVVIGSDGFGFAESATGLKKIRQIGWVEIADDVEIGANTTIDRGAIGPTKVGRGTKIDNLVQIAHNVEIGDNCIIVSQVGISGSTKIGNGVILGGQVGLVGHIEIGDSVRVGAQSGVSKSIADSKTVFGTPARDIMQTKRIEASLVRLPELLKRVKAIERKFDE